MKAVQTMAWAIQSRIHHWIWRYCTEGAPTSAGTDSSSSKLCLGLFFCRLFLVRWEETKSRQYTTVVAELFEWWAKGWQNLWDTSRRGKCWAEPWWAWSVTVYFPRGWSFRRVRANQNTTAVGETNVQDYHPRTHYLLRNCLHPIHSPQYLWWLSWGRPSLEGGGWCDEPMSWEP